MWELILKLLVSLGALGGAFLTYQKKKLNEKNTSDIKKRKKSQDSVNQRNEAEKLVGEAGSNDQIKKEKALDEIRKRMSK